MWQLMEVGMEEGPEADLGILEELDVRYVLFPIPTLDS